MQEAVYGAMLVDRRTTCLVVGSHISSGQYFNPVCRAMSTNLHPIAVGGFDAYKCTLKHLWVGLSVLCDFRNL
jgi:hypothetical protein